MKPKICSCSQCLAVKRRIRKRNRIQTYQLRAARHHVHRLLKTLPYDEVEDFLPKAVRVMYYG